MKTTLVRSPKSSACDDLFDHWDALRKRLRAAKRIFLFLDFDGTLVGFRPLPHQARLRAETRRVLAEVAAHRRVRAAIVSGRRRADLAKRVSVPGVAFMGLYGWDRAGHKPLPARALAKMALARKELAAAEAGLPGVFIEDKRVSLAAHFRGAPPRDQRLLRQRISRMMRRLRPELHVIGSSTTWEITPRQIRGKGVALREFLAGVRKPYLPIYLGDDWTDEPAFRALRKKGITVLVGPARKTAAQYRLAGHGEVATFLKRLAAELD